LTYPEPWFSIELWQKTLAVKIQWAKVNGQIPIEAGDETWQVKIEKI
jgi:hypothetical protein